MVDKVECFADLLTTTDTAIPNCNRRFLFLLLTFENSKRKFGILPLPSLELV